MYFHSRFRVSAFPSFRVEEIWVVLLAYLQYNISYHVYNTHSITITADTNGKCGMGSWAVLSERLYADAKIFRRAIFEERTDS